MQTNSCTAAWDLQFTLEKTPTFLRAAVPISDIAMLHDTFEYFALTQRQAAASQKVHYTYLAYLEVISNVTFFFFHGMCYLIEKKKPNQKPNKKREMCLTLEISLLRHRFIFFVWQSTEREREGRRKKAGMKEGKPAGCSMEPELWQ